MTEVVVKKKSSVVTWVIVLVIAVLAGLGIWYYSKSKVGADVAGVSGTKEISRTVFSAVLKQDYLPGSIIVARVVQGNKADIGKVIYIRPNKSGTTFMTPQSSGSGYSYGSFGSSSKLIKGDKIIVSGSKISGFSSVVQVAADAITLTSKRTIKNDSLASEKAVFKSEGFKMAVRGKVIEVKDYYNVVVKITEGIFGTDTINLSPIWGISSVSDLKLNDEVLLGLNYSRWMLVGEGQDGAIYTADSIVVVSPSTTSPTSTVTATKTATTIATATATSTAGTGVTFKYYYGGNWYSNATRVSIKKDDEIKLVATWDTAPLTAPTWKTGSGNNNVLAITELSRTANSIELSVKGKNSGSVYVTDEIIFSGTTGRGSFTINVNPYIPS